MPPTVYDEIKAIETAFVEKTRTDVIAMEERALQLLLENNGAEEDVYLLPSKVFAHPQNRDMEILNAHRAHTRIEKVHVGGYSHGTACKDAVCFQDNPNTRAIANTAIEVCAKSDAYAQYTVHNISHGSVGSSHFNHGLECARQGVPCNIPSISVDGRMSRTLLETKSPDGFKVAFQRGIPWKVIRWEIEVMFPFLPLLFQGGLQAKGQIQEGDSSKNKIYNKSSHAIMYAR